MQERQVTIEGKTSKMDFPFIVIATQNPIEHEGTYRLPEAQLDRFLFKINVGYPDLEEETEIISRYHSTNHQLNENQIQPVISSSELKTYHELVSKIHIEDKLIKYIAEIVQKTRESKSLYIGASPRASLAILAGSKAYAAINGRDFVQPEDIKFIAHPVIGHRVILSPEKEMEGTPTEEVVNQIIQTVEVPR